MRIGVRARVGMLLVVGLAAAGCGSDSSSSKSTAVTTPAAVTTAAAETTAATSAAAETTAAVETTAAAETTTPVLSGDPIKIGVLITSSGPLAFITALFKPSIEMWAQENKALGINGRPFELVYRDDGGTAATAATAARQLIDEDKVDVVLGLATSDPSSGALPLLMDAKKTVVMMSGFVPARDPATFPYTYGFEFSSASAGASFVRAIKQTGVTKVGYIGPNNTLGNATGKVVASSVGAAGVTLVDSEFYEPGATDVLTQLQKLQSAGAEAIVSGEAVAPAIVTIFDGINTLGWKVQIVGTSALADYNVIKNANADVLSQAIATGFTKQVCLPLSSEVASWRTRYLAFVGRDDVENRLYHVIKPNDELSFIKWAIEGAGSTDADAIKAFVEGKGTYEGIGGTYSFDAKAHTGPTEDVSVRPGTYDNGAFECIQ